MNRTVAWIGLTGLVVVLGGVLLLQEHSSRAGFRRDRYNVVLVSVDALRADHLGLYGYVRPTTPSLEALVRMKPALVFDQAVSPSPRSLPAHASLFSSLDPSVHGIGGLEGVEPLRTFGSLTATLAREGWQTAAFVDGDDLLPGTGVERGFERYDVTPREAAAGPDAFDRLRRKVLDANRWLSEIPKGEPFFLFFHTSLPTLPFRPQHPNGIRFDPDYPDFSERDVTREWLESRMKDTGDLGPTGLRHVIAQYDGEIATVDGVIGEWLYRLLQNAEFRHDTVFVFLSTHGMELLEHGMIGTGHPTLFDSSLRVPLIVWVPDRTRGGVVTMPVRLVDLAPTLLDLLGVRADRPLQGSSFLDRIHGRDEDPRPAVSEIPTPTYWIRSLRVPPYRILLDPKLGGPVLFDLERDPSSTTNVAGERQEATERLREALDAHVRDAAALRLRIESEP